VDTLCFSLFDRTPHAWKKVDQWSRRPEEFVKRSAFALVACLALHDKASGDAPFLRALKLIEKAGSDDRNFVKKGVSWGLRVLGPRNLALNKAVEVAGRMAESKEPAARSVGKEALRELTSPAVRKALAKRSRASRARGTGT
jgi:3-methyladenine DNA glycosylase AlkD